MLSGNSSIIRWNEAPGFGRGWFTLSPSRRGRAAQHPQPAASFTLKAPGAFRNEAASLRLNSVSRCGDAAGSSSSVAQHLLDGSRGMVARLCEVGSFIRRLRAQLRFSGLSRAPLQLLRFELQADFAACDWIARPPDRWDVELQFSAAERNASTQALKDAIQIRELLFLALPGLSSADLRVYRQRANEKPQLILEGSVSREQRVAASVRSLAMRAKLFGLHFWLNDGVLEDLPSEDRAANAEPRSLRMRNDGFLDRAATEGGRRPPF